MAERSNSRAHGGGRLGTYRARQQAQALADLDQRAAGGDPEAQRIAAMLADWREVLEVPTDG
jgi:hypothetical protein